MVLRKSCRVLRKYKPRSILLESKEVPDHVLLFESDIIAALTPVEVEILKKEAYTDSISAYGILGVLVLGQEHQFLVLVTECVSVGKVKSVEIFRLTQATFVPLSLKSKIELVQDVGKLLASGQFYFAYPSFSADFDLLACAQKQGVEQPHFYWNRGLTAYLQRFGVDLSKWLFRTICGHASVQTVYAGDKQAKLCLFSRLSCERAGTRFNVRGIDDEGHVANFVETEQAIYVDNSVSSFVQVRGLVPLFWDQPGLQTGGGTMTRIKFSRGYNCSQPAFERHFEWCLLHYGPILCLNLLGSRDFEVTLTNAFQEHLSQLSTAYCSEMRCFDYHHTCRGAGGGKELEATLLKHLLPLVQQFKWSHGLFLSCDGQPGSQQTGTIRTNCLDCLDRSNSVQSFFGQQTLAEQLECLGLPDKQAIVNRFKQQLTSAWFKNGDALSRLYSGTRALKFEGKSKLKDGARSVQRTIQSNFLDSNKQEAIDMLLLGTAYSGELGLHSKALLENLDLSNPIPFRKMLCERWRDFTSAEKLKVAVGTWNVNGGTRIRSIALKHQSLSDWLLDAPTLTGVVKEHPQEFLAAPDVYVIGFQELVGLTASNIVSASSSNRKEWGAELERVLSRDQPYELLTAEQLVGVCLYVFISPKLTPYIRDVAVSSVKTGMSGKTGNKGGVAIRFLYHTSSFCFVCSHFAAHQTKVLERNQDYTDICKKISFPHGQSIDSHDYVFWCGDLNYRIDLPTSMAKDHIANRRWTKIHKHDQLSRQKRLNKIFQGYIEGELDFAPTYKYDEFSDDYDTSDKCRTPAWCDRVLWRRKRHNNTENGRRPSNPHLQPDSVSKDFDFGPHASDATSVCYHDLAATTATEVGVVSPSHVWHPGRLIYYNRAELKQSDHRPVLAIFEVDVFRVDAGKRSKVREEVSLARGPPDPTVVVQEKDGSLQLSVQDLLTTLNEYGEVVLVRVTQESILITFKESPSALAALALNEKEVLGTKLAVTLHSQWPPGSSHPASPARAAATVTVLTSSKLMRGEDSSVGGAEAEEPDQILEFTFSSDDVEDVSKEAEEEEEGNAELTEAQDLTSSTDSNHGPPPRGSPTPPSRPGRPPQPSRPPNPSPANITANGSSKLSPHMPRPPPPRPVMPPRPSTSSSNSLTASNDSLEPHRPPMPPRPSRPPPPKK